MTRLRTDTTCTRQPRAVDPLLGVLYCSRAVAVALGVNVFAQASDTLMAAASRAGAPEINCSIIRLQGPVSITFLPPKPRAKKETKGQQERAAGMTADSSRRAAAEDETMAAEAVEDAVIFRF